MLKFIERYADKMLAQKWQHDLEVHSNSLEFPHHVYCVAGEDVDGFVWLKIGRSQQLLSRIQGYNYPAHFQELEIKELIDLRLVAWRTEEESVRAEAYMHARLRPFRHDAREWFTNYGTTISSDNFTDLFLFHWSSLCIAGATAYGEGSLRKLFSTGRGFPMIQSASGSLIL